MWILESYWHRESFFFAQKPKRKHNARINVSRKPWNVQKNDKQKNDEEKMMKKKYRKNIRQQQRDNEIHEMNAILAVLYIMYWRDIFVFCCIIVFLYIFILRRWYQASQSVRH